METGPPAARTISDAMVEDAIRSLANAPGLLPEEMIDPMTGEIIEQKRLAERR